MKDPFAPEAAVRLKPIDVPGHPTPIDLVATGDGSARLTVGRSDDNDLALVGEAFPSVSSHHARFDLRDGAFEVTDLGSKNGVLVNGTPIGETHALAVGDQVRLGSVGPRFLVVGGRSLEETVFVRREASTAASEDVETIVQRGSRAVVLRVAALVAVLGGAVGWFVWDSTRTRERLEGEIAEREESYNAQLQEAYAMIAALDERERDRAQKEMGDEEARVERVQRLESELVDRAQQLETAVASQAAEEARLRDRIDELEERGAAREVLERVARDLQTARDDLDATKDALEDARRRVDLLDPVNLAQARLSGVADVRRCVVLIENSVKVRNVETGETLHLRGKGASTKPNFRGLGEEFVLESTGSGFCVHPDGWILTNAHVVGPPASELLEAIGSAPMLERVIELNVVFSDTSRRYPARVHALADDDIDLALVKIEPFEGMPALEGFETEVDPPLPGSDIFLFGFPLGFLAVQEGETVIASTFRGILSRNVGGQIQVDAGVHPGNSGGPITDSAGRVVGVVVSVQALPDRTAVYTIGYGIPIGEAANLWPPEESGSPVDPAAVRDPRPDESGPAETRSGG
ncbi:MAG: trypsin-like peptidase domain-containing protein [Planctomycetota bacterium]